jgi:hypothetical protein
MSSTFIMHDWRLLERIVGLTHRMGCAYTRVHVQADGAYYTADIDFTGPPESLRRLSAQLTRLLNDDKELHS